jgi:hypothetical protein
MRYLRIGFRINRSAARLFRRDCTRQSSTSPSASTARHRYIAHAANGDEHLIEVPRRMRLGAHRPQASGDHRSEHCHPTSDRFVGDIDTAFGEQLFDISEAQREAAE